MEEEEAAVDDGTATTSTLCIAAHNETLSDVKDILPGISFTGTPHPLVHSGTSDNGQS